MSRRLAVASLGGLLAAGLLAIGLHTAGATEPGARKPPATPSAVGRLFLVGCASCHGQNGEGTAQGPDLRGWAPPPPTSSCRRDACRTRRPTGSPSPSALRTRGGDRRPRRVRRVARARSAHPRRAQPAGDLQEGGELYLDNCAACHSAASGGGAR